MVTALFSLLLILEAALAFQSHPFPFGAQWKPLQQLNQASSSIDDDEGRTLPMKERGILRELCFGVPVAVSTIAAALLPAQPVFGLSAEDAAKACDSYAEMYDELDEVKQLPCLALTKREPTYSKGLRETCWKLGSAQD